MLIQFHTPHFTAEETSTRRGKTNSHRLGIFPDSQYQTPRVTLGGRRVKASTEIALAKAAWDRFSMESAEEGEPPVIGEGVWKDFQGEAMCHKPGSESYLGQRWEGGGSCLKGQRNKGREHSAGMGEGSELGEKWR